jgi:hypothetical protein
VSVNARAAHLQAAGRIKACLLKHRKGMKMGATGWSYFVPYQQDINAALEELKDKVFKQGQYEHPFDFERNEIEGQLDYLASVYGSLPEEIQEHTDQFLELARAAAKQQRPKRTPKSIEQLLGQCGTEGTHSILDIERISSTPGFGAIAPFPHEKLLELFGTEQPTRDMVEKWSARIDSPDAEPSYERWEGIYISVYKDGKPVEIYFEGCSGD